MPLLPINVDGNHCSPKDKTGSPGAESAAELEPLPGDCPPYPTPSDDAVADERYPLNDA